MKQGTFTNEQIVAVLAEAEKGDKAITALCKEKAITEQTFYRWRNKFGGMQTKDVQRLRELEKENARLKRLLTGRGPQDGYGTDAFPGTGAATSL